MDYSQIKEPTLIIGGPGGGKLPGELHHPTSLTFDPTENSIYVVENGERIQVLDMNGQHVRFMAVTADFHPESVVYVDQPQPRIAVASKGGVYLFGTDGRIAKSLTTHIQTMKHKKHITVDESGLVYSADDSGIITLPPTGLPGQRYSSVMYKPGSIAVNPVTGNIYITDRNNGTVRQFSSAGKVKPDLDCALKSPTAIATDNFGNIIVCDSDKGKVVIFNADGERLHWFDVPAPPDGIRPLFGGIALTNQDQEGHVGHVCVSDYNNNRIVIF